MLLRGIKALTQQRGWYSKYSTLETLAAGEAAKWLLTGFETIFSV
jgi:hypothetical protein